MNVDIWPQTESAIIRYGASILASLIGFLISYFLFPLFLSPVFFLPFIAVMISALYGGWGPGLLAVFLSGISFIYYLLPLTDPSGHPVSHLIRLDVFLLFSLLICWISASFRSAYRALVAARAEAEEANKYKSQLIANVSHDLRTPLNAIIGYTQLLRYKTYGPICEPQDSALEGIQRNAGDLLKMVNDILDLAKIESGKLPVKIASVEISQLIEEVLSEVRPLTDQKGLLLQYPLPQRLQPIESDRMKIKQILINLLSNAIKFTNNGMIRVMAKDREDHHGIEILVQDTGIGIRPEALPKIFESFYQIDGMDKPKGSGLGLAIVRDLTHLLNGEIEVDSKWGAGSTFTLFLPYRIFSERPFGAADRIQRKMD
ncbi:MAG: HAMP domain-containing histidine kinase [Nitrospirae bacterium]|nr:HAMP domain-containing histidine kinase [Candidatus Manganitrophaceae bacterium]